MLHELSQDVPTLAILSHPFTPAHDVNGFQQNGLKPTPPIKKRFNPRRMVSRAPVTFNETPVSPKFIEQGGLPVLSGGRNFVDEAMRNVDASRGAVPMVTLPSGVGAWDFGGFVQGIESVAGGAVEAVENIAGNPTTIASLEKVGGNVGTGASAFQILTDLRQMSPSQIMTVGLTSFISSLRPGGSSAPAPAPSTTAVVVTPASLPFLQQQTMGISNRTWVLSGAALSLLAILGFMRSRR